LPFLILYQSLDQLLCLRLYLIRSGLQASRMGRVAYYWDFQISNSQIRFPCRIKISNRSTFSGYWTHEKLSKLFRLWDDVLSRVWTSGWNFSRVKIILHYRKKNSIRRWDFYKLPLQGAKLADYEDFKRAAELMKVTSFHSARFRR
jgi:hypothetical protein